MSNVREFHDRAMQLAHLAMIARHNQEWERAESLAREASTLETHAAELVPASPTSEPTRSILFRSAASLAYQCKDFSTAQRLIAKGLSGFPPPQVEQELKDLYEQVNFENHLKVRGIILENEDLQLSLQGKNVGFGTIIYDEFLKRIKTTRTLIDRTVQRILGAPYQRAGRIAKTFRPFIPTLAAPRPSSFAITIKLAIEDGGQMPLFITASQVIDEIMAGVELINNSDERVLKERFQQDSYYRNFIALTKDMAPDGDKISLVGFTSVKRAVGLTRQREQIDLLLLSEGSQKAKSERTPIRVEGLLDYATARRRKEAIGLTTESGDEYLLVVQEGFDDLVRNYFKQWVVVTGMRDQKNIYLSDVQPGE